VYGLRVRGCPNVPEALGPSEEFALKAGAGSGVFWGLMAAGALATVLAVAVLVGYLIGHNTHTVTKTVTQESALVRSVPAATATSVRRG
jgi:hypothetical protein